MDHIVGNHLVFHQYHWWYSPASSVTLWLSTWTSYI